MISTFSTEEKKARLIFEIEEEEGRITVSSREEKRKHKKG